MTKWILAALILLGPSMLGVVIIQQPAVVGGPTATLNDQMNDATDSDWTGEGGVTCTTFNSNAEILMSNEIGMCIYDETGGPHGDQPTDLNQWGVMQYGSDAERYSGMGLRTKQTGAGTSDFNYVIRCNTLSNERIELRACHSYSNCSTIATWNFECSGAAMTGDRIALMVAGGSTDTEFCFWWWESADSAPSSWDDPTTWGDADYCLSDGGFPLLGDGTTDYVGTASTALYTDGCCQYPDFARGYPAAGNLSTGLYMGNSFDTSWDWFISGDLNL